MACVLRDFFQLIYCGDHTPTLSWTKNHEITHPLGLDYLFADSRCSQCRSGPEIFPAYRPPWHALWSSRASPEGISHRTGIQLSKCGSAAWKRGKCQLVEASFEKSSNCFLTKRRKVAPVQKVFYARIRIAVFRQSFRRMTEFAGFERASHLVGQKSVVFLSYPDK